MEELDAEPTAAELSNVIDSLASDKAQGGHGISPDLIKHCTFTILIPLHEVLCQSWQKGVNMRDAKIKIKDATAETTETSLSSASTAKSSFGSS